MIAKAAPTPAAPKDDELAAFQAEMSALGAVAAPGPELEDPLRAETPEPEDRRFQDDDGTWYIWDALLRKFVEEVRSSCDDAQHDMHQRSQCTFGCGTLCVHAPAAFP